MSYLVTIVGTVGDQVSRYAETDIIQILQSGGKQLQYGTLFTGRPGTKIYANDAHVIKIHTELHLETASALRWTSQSLHKEQQYRIHHPHKTWFIATCAEEKYALIGNICPRLQALHHLCDGKSADSAVCLRYLTDLFEHYFRLAQQNIRLDEGLSNFGVDEEGVLYYLDDDLYTWDRFISCAHMLGVHFRYLTWMTPDLAAELGENLRRLIQKYFDDSHYLTVLAEQLRDVFMPRESQQTLIEQFIHALTQRPVHVPPVDLSKNRYIALLADIHANLPALQVVLDFLKKENIQQGIVLGDIVGYGPYPAECIERLQTTGFLIVKGNHDHGLATGHFQKGFSNTAAWALEWSSQHVSAAHKEWLLNLPSVIHEEHWMALHGAPIDPTFFNAYVYEMTYHDNLDVLMQKDIPYCFHGHTHQPGVYGRRGSALDYHYQDKVIGLRQFKQALICPGSIGQPRNNQTGAQFAIYDQVEQSVYYHTLPYPTDEMFQKMQHWQFPETLFRLLK